MLQLTLTIGILILLGGGISWYILIKTERENLTEIAISQLSSHSQLIKRATRYGKCDRERDATIKCPAYPHFGRICWVVAGTFCEGKVQGTFAQKFEDCRKCEFYQKRIKREI